MKAYDVIMKDPIASEAAFDFDPSARICVSSVARLTQICRLGANVMKLLRTPVLRRLPEMILELLGKLKGGMEPEDICNLLYRTCCAREQFLRLLQADLAMILFGTETDPLRERLSQMRVAHAEFGSDRGKTETFLAAEGDERMGPFDQLVDPPIESRRTLQVADHREQMRAHR